jgi:penicillin amidase
MQMRRVAETAADHLTDEERSVFVEYARGVNFFIDRNRGNYPVEFRLPGHSYDPVQWTVVDSVLTGLLMFRDLTDSAQQKFGKATLLNIADAAKVQILFPPVLGQYVNPGSNAWAVSGAHTQDGRPMAANDPHLSFGIPPTWHLVQLKAPGLNVSGAALPGVPCVLTGHNENIAWGLTNLEADVMDFYNEQIDERNGRYVFQGSVQQAQLDNELIGVKDGKPIQVATWITRHGPVVVHESGKTYSMHWSAADGFSFPFFAINEARNWNDFRNALSRFWGPPQNFVYADSSGNIGFQAAGRIPIRHGFNGDVPLDGSSGNFEWDGYIPFEQLPSFYNPPSGSVVTANQNPFPPSFPYQINGTFADAYRADQIKALLAKRSKLSVQDMLRIQTDVYSAHDFFLARQAIKAFAKKPLNDNLVRDAVGELQRWNGQMDKNEAAPMITQLLNNTLGATLVSSLLRPDLRASSQRQLRSQPQNASEKTGKPESNSPGRATAPVSGVPDILPRSAVIDGLLRNRPTGWVANDDWDSWLLQNLHSALEQGRQAQGTPISKWRWGRMLRWTFAHPVGKNIPFFNQFFDIGPVDMSGSGTTVKQTTSAMGPSERMVVDLGDLDKSVQNLTTGESGHVASAHYKDEWTAYYNGTSFPMEFHDVRARETLRVNPSRY